MISEWGPAIPGHSLGAPEGKSAKLSQTVDSEITL